MDKYKSKTNIQIYYHMYKSNLGKEFKGMVRLAQDLGFNLTLGMATFQGVEKNIAYLKGASLPGEDAVFMDKCIFSTREIVEMVDDVYLPDCGLRANQTVINHDGSVALCCGIFDPVNNICPSFLEKSIEEIMALKYMHPLCKHCMESSLYKTILTYGHDGIKTELNARLKNLGFPYKIRTENPRWLVDIY